MKMLTRREVLGSLAGIASLPLVPELAQALAGMQAAADWRIAFADLESNLPSTPLICVQGNVPRDLAGTLYRNGPGKWHRPGNSATHWFDGDGLVRAFSLGDGKATLTAAFVDTPKRRADEAAHAVVSGGFGTPMAEHVNVSSSDDFNAAINHRRSVAETRQAGTTSTRRCRTRCRDDRHESPTRGRQGRPASNRSADGASRSDLSRQ